MRIVAYTQNPRSMSELRRAKSPNTAQNAQFSIVSLSLGAGFAAVYAVRASLRRSNRETTGNDSLIMTGRVTLDDMQPVTTTHDEPRRLHHRRKGDNAIREVEEFQVALSAVTVLELSLCQTSVEERLAPRSRVCACLNRPLPAAKLTVRTERFGSAEPCFPSLCST
jgi:hypothetical protein